VSGHGAAADVGPPTSAVGRWDRWYGTFEAALNFIAGVSIFLLMLIGVGQIAGRQILGLPIYGYIDYIEEASAIFAFLGIAYCQRTGTHIRMELVLGLLPRRLMWVFEAFAIVVALVIMGLLIWASWFDFLRAWQLGDSTMDIRLPTWPGKLLVPLAFTTLWLRLLLQLWGYLRLAADPSAKPEGVPVVLTTEEQAQAEIEEALRSERSKPGGAA
jgi:TRAP-type C4-dicarboxylate transport system permease small subunit